MRLRNRVDLRDVRPSSVRGDGEGRRRCWRRCPWSPRCRQDAGALGDDAVATWDLAAGQSLGAGTTTFMAMVTRLGCNNGVTGTANDPGVEVTDDLVVVTFTVSPGEPGAASCPGNNQVAFEVRLPEALGDRSLLDGACLSTEAKDTAPCVGGGARFAP